jgi:hypothetical protein
LAETSSPLNALRSQSAYLLCPVRRTLNVKMKIIRIYIIPLLLAMCIGTIVDYFIYPEGADPSLSCFAEGFSIIIPISVALLLILLRSFKARNIIIFLISGASFFFLSMIFRFWFYEVRQEYISDMYGAIYVAGAIPSAILGLIFGLFLYISMKNI